MEHPKDLSELMLKRDDKCDIDSKYLYFSFLMFSRSIQNKIQQLELRMQDCHWIRKRKRIFKRALKSNKEWTSFTAEASWCRTKPRTPALMGRASWRSPMPNCSISWESCCSSRRSPLPLWCLAGSCSSTIRTSSPGCRWSGCWARRSGLRTLSRPAELSPAQHRGSTSRARLFSSTLPLSCHPPVCWLPPSWGWGWAGWGHYHKEFPWSRCRRPTRWLPWECPLQRRGPYRSGGCACTRFCREWAWENWINYTEKLGDVHFNCPII